MRLIDADALLEGRQDHEMISTHLIFNAPTIDAMPVRHGRWKYVLNGLRFMQSDGIVQCNVCGHSRGRRVGDILHYCPNCGADMRGAENAEIH